MGLALSPSSAAAAATPVELQQTEQGWQLLRGGEPYFVRGAGGNTSLEALAAAGANSVRTWSTENVETLLDEAHALGLSVTVGLWLGHERHGFDYDDADQVRVQQERMREAVLRYKDHPAVLLWGIGNEAEGFESGDNPAIWKAINDIAVMINKIDPAHPTMTVTAEIGGMRVEAVRELCPAIDIHGINSYGGTQSLPQRLKAAGASKPYIVTEFGPLGPWEAGQTDWGAPIEPTSSEKAAFYRQSYERGVAGAPGVALGSYAFLWGNKMEATATWFGMFLDDGSRLAAVDTMTELWSGQAPADRAPAIDPLTIDGPTAVDPRTVIRVAANVEDPEGGNLDVRWMLRPESGDYTTGGDFRPNLPDIDGAVIASDARGARVRMPEEPGSYRLFVYAYDEVGNAATANMPLLVKGQPRARLPVTVYEDGFDSMPWAPSGWMGATESVTLDGLHADNVHEGAACIRLRYDGEFGWAGIAWQNPPDNWGEMDGGYDLTGAKELEVWARGEYGGEHISIGVGLLGDDRDYPDSGQAKVDGIALTREWQRYRVPLKRVDLSSIKTGFVVTVTGRRTPVTIYLDSIRFVR